MPPPPSSGVLARDATARPQDAADEATPPPATERVFHVALRLAGERCLVVGGGAVAARKATSLVDCGADVTVVAPAVCDAMEALPVRVLRRPYSTGEAGAYRLVVTATGIKALDRQVYLDAEEAGILVNAADDPASCSFLMPAVLRQGDVSVAVSTAGVSPFLAGWLRRRISAIMGPEVGELAAVVGEARAAIRRSGVSSEGLEWDQVVDGTLWPLVGAGELELARATAARWVEAVVAANAQA
jgi:siroheme synthase-like protein